MAKKPGMTVTATPMPERCILVIRSVRKESTLAPHAICLCGGEDDVGLLMIDREHVVGEMPWAPVVRLPLCAGCRETLRAALAMHGVMGPYDG